MSAKRNAKSAVPVDLSTASVRKLKTMTQRMIQDFHNRVGILCATYRLPPNHCKMLLYLQLLPEWTQEQEAEFISRNQVSTSEALDCDPNKGKS